MFLEYVIFVCIFKILVRITCSKNISYALLIILKIHVKNTDVSLINWVEGINLEENFVLFAFFKYLIHLKAT